MASTLVTSLVGGTVTGSFGVLSLVLRSAKDQIQGSLRANREQLQEQLRENRETLDRRLDDIETGMSRSIGQVLTDVKDVKDGLQHLDRRVTRLESWRELMSLPHEMQDRRRPENNEGNT